MICEITTKQRANELVEDHLFNIHRGADRLFAILLFVQWIACIGAAIWISPQTWAGTMSSVHMHVWAAILLGATLAAFPISLAILKPGQLLTRHSIAIAQLLFSALLIHLTGGRIETHFHVFGSLALLAAYRDWRVLVTATIVVVLDHGIRGAIWPESVFGVVAAAPWRTLEHAGWVAFENIFLIVIIRQSIVEMRNIGQQQAALENTNRLTELIVESRTAELKKAEERLQLIINNVPNGVVMIDRDGAIQLANPKIKRLFGYETADLLGKKFQTLFSNPVSGFYPESNHGACETIRAGALDQSEDIVGVRCDGSEFPVELGLKTMQTKDGIFVLAAIQDITEQKQAALILKQNAARLESINADLEETQSELEAKNRELDEFSYVASHDLQEPVRKLISFSKLLEKDLGDELNDRAKKDLQFIVDAASRMRRLVQDLLSLSRAGRAAMKQEMVCISECVDHAVAALQMRTEETNAEIVFDNLPTVVGDPTMLTQLYQNLIGNALKFIGDEKPVIQLTVEDGGDEWILGVKDNGIGMKPEHAERIFKPFQRLHRRDQYEGTGIGLSICKKTVERHHGQLWVESAIGEGAHFKFTLSKPSENAPCLESNPVKETKLQSC